MKVTATTRSGPIFSFVWEGAGKEVHVTRNFIRDAVLLSPFHISIGKPLKIKVRDLEDYQEDNEVTVWESTEVIKLEVQG